MENNNTIIHSTLDEGYDFFITDKWGNEKHFKISIFEVPSGLLSEAFEVIKSNIDDEPRVFHILSNFDYFFQIDGKKITIEKFIDLLKGVEGWNFKFQIIDTTDDID